MVDVPDPRLISPPLMYVSPPSVKLPDALVKVNKELPPSVFESLNCTCVSEPLTDGGIKSSMHVLLIEKQPAAMLNPLLDVDVAVVVSVSLPLDNMSPPVMVRPWLDVKPPPETESPALENVDVAVPR